MIFIISFKYSQHFNIKFVKLLLSFMFLTVSKVTLSAAIEISGVEFDPIPLRPSIIETVSIKVIHQPNINGLCRIISLNGISTNILDKTVKVSFQAGFIFAGCPTEEVILFPIGKLPEIGDFQVSIYFSDDPVSPQSLLYDEQRLIGSFILPVKNSSLNSEHTTPASDSSVVGIGEISGWVCDANKVDAQIDDNDLFPIIYGTPREDSETVCGDLNNGYTFPINWDNLGLGDHRLQIFVDDTQTTSVEFNVSDIESVNYDSMTRIVTFPKVTVDKNKAYINIELLLGIDGAWDILSIEPESE